MGSLTKPPQVPAINMEGLKEGTEAWASARDAVRHALEEYGCFVAVLEQKLGDEKLVTELFDALKTIFDLPTETKVKNTSKKLFHGYLGPSPTIPLYEGMGVEDPTTLEGLQSFASLLWPSGNDHFCKIFDWYTKLVIDLDATVSKMMFESYGVKDYDSHHKSQTYGLRMMKYKSPEVNGTNVGALSHTDKTLFTILNQNEVNGLDIQDKNGEWIEVNYPPTSLVVMAGDALMAWSNNRVQSPYHRVTIKERKDRYSTGMFIFHNGVIEVPEEVVDEQHPRKFKSFSHNEYLRFFAKDVYGDANHGFLKEFCGV